jgi:hypothetical protein
MNICETYREWTRNVFDLENPYLRFLIFYLTLFPIRLLLSVLSSDFELYPIFNRVIRNQDKVSAPSRA